MEHLEKCPEELKQIFNHFHKLRAWEVVKENFYTSESCDIYQVFVQHKKPNNIERQFTIYFNGYKHAKEMSNSLRPSGHHYLVEMWQENFVCCDSSMATLHTSKWKVDEEDSISFIKTLLNWRLWS